MRRVKSLMSGRPGLVEAPVRRPAIVRPSRVVDFSQADARERRRGGWGLDLHYVEFDVVAEVEAVCRPLAVEVQALTSGSRMLRDMRDPGVRVDPHYEVEVIADAVHSVRLAVAKILAGLSPAVLPDGARERLAVVVRDPAHAKAPDVSVEDLRTGAWVDSLVRHVAPLSADLAAVVGASKAGTVSALDLAISEAFSSWGLDLVAFSFDQAVGALERRFPELRARRAQAVAGRAAAACQADRAERDRVDRALRDLRLS